MLRCPIFGRLHLLLRTSAIVALGLCGLTGPALSVELFGPGPVLTSLSWTAAVSDFDGDGNQDLATLFGGDVSLLLGDGHGGFSQSAVLPAGWSWVESAAAGEFNGDGAPDLAMVKYALVDGAVVGSVGLLLGDGRGGFSYDADYAVGGEPKSIAAGEFNGDGALDLAVANADSDTVTILQGNGAGGFSRAADLPVGDRPSFVAVGDFNGDGAQDLSVPNSLSQTVTVLLGDGLGGFSRGWNDLGVGMFPAMVAVGDFNRDGFQDFVVASLFSNNVTVFLGNGTDRMSRSAILPVGEFPTAVAVGEFNGDGAQDLAVANLESHTVTILLGDGLGGFARTADLPGLTSGSVTAGEFNGDGVQDLVLRNYILFGDGLGGFSHTADTPVGNAAVSTVGDRPYSLAIGEFNGDGNKDVAVANYTSRTVTILLGEGLGVFSRAADLPMEGNPISVAVGEFNDDEMQDLAVANQRGSLTILLGDGLGGFSWMADLPIEIDVASVTAGDFNGDEAQDLATVDFAYSTVTVFLGDGLGGFAHAAEQNVGDGPLSLATGEFNRDGALDLAVASYRADTVTILLGNGLGGFTRLADLRVGRLPRDVTVGDLNGDGLQDLATANYDGTVTVLLGEGHGGFLRLADRQVGGLPSSISVGEFNGDGNEDLAIPNLLSLTVLLGDGFGGFPGRADLAAPDPVAVSAGEFNGDGAQDLAVTNLQTSSLTVFLNQLDLRTDLNGTNRIDGFDVATLSRLAACAVGDACYRGNADINLDGEIDGEDLALLAPRFGQILKAASPLRPAVDAASPAPVPDTVTFQQDASAGDLLTLRVEVNDSDNQVAAADFQVAFDPAVLQFAGFEPGTYLAGPEVLPVYDVIPIVKGRIGVKIGRLPSQNKMGAGMEPLMNLIFRARGTGQTSLDFDPNSLLLDADGQEVTGISFVGGATVTVDASSGGPPAQRIAVSQDVLDFRWVFLGETARKSLRITNLGFSDLTVLDVLSPSSEVTSFFSGQFRIPAFSHVELPVVFSPVRAEPLSGELTIVSDDPLRAMVRIPLRGKGIDCPLDPERDIDGDGICGNIDNCPDSSNTGQADNDGDGLGNPCDPCPLDALNDTDADGVCGNLDNCPTGYNPAQQDGDGDGSGDACDQCPWDPLDDVDEDGACGDSDNCPALYNPSQADGEGDTIGDSCDNCLDQPNPDQVDADLDWIGDACDPCPLDPHNDADTDGACGDSDNCPLIYNPSQTDGDGDLVGDACDACPSDPLNVDPDGDSNCGDFDNCPDLYNPSQTDADADSVGDACDNCPDQANPSQEDRNTDGSGDACQPDIAILDIAQDGGAELEVTVHLADPQADPVGGVIRILTSITLDDLETFPDCARTLPPEFLPGQGIAFGTLEGHRPRLLDYDGLFGCSDGFLDYELAWGSCGQAGQTFASSLSLGGVVPPQPVCIQRADQSSRYDYEVLGFDTQQAVLRTSLIDAPYQDSVLPDHIDLSRLVPGQTYTLEITATDGMTPPVADWREFLYQGEATIRFLRE